MDLITALAPHLPWLTLAALPILLLTGYPVAFLTLFLAILAALLGQMSGALQPELAAQAPNRLITQLVASDWPLSLLLMTLFACSIGPFLPVRSARRHEHQTSWLQDSRVRFLIGSGGALVLLSHMLAIPLGLVYMAAAVPALIIYLLYLGDRQISRWGCERQSSRVDVDGSSSVLAPAEKSVLVGVKGLPLALPSLLGLPALLLATGIWTIEQALCLASALAWSLTLLLRRRAGCSLWSLGPDSLMATANLALIILASLTFLIVFADIGGNAWLIRHGAIASLENWGLIGLCLAGLMGLAFLMPWPLILVVALSLLAPQITLLDGSSLSSTLAQFAQTASQVADRAAISTPARLWLAILLWLCFQPPILVQTFGREKSSATGLAHDVGKTHNASKAALSLIVILLIVLGIVLLMPQVALLLPYSVFA